MLGQCGLFTPAARARLPLVQGLFASILDHEGADQAEGRLGTELVRIRELFERARPGSFVLLDELCSGTNPSEAVEIFSMVLQLLERLEPVAFISTHFLDFARELAAAPPILSAAPIAMILGLDGALALVVGLLATLLTPLTVPPLAEARLRRRRHAVAAGARRTIARCRPFIVFEHGRRSSLDFGVDSGEIYDELAACGLRVQVAPASTKVARATVPTKALR